MNVTKFDVLSVLKEQNLDDEFTKTEIQTELDKIDQTAEKQAVRDTMIVERWDGKADINGVTPETIRQKHNINGHECFLIRDANSGKVIIFQPNKPKVGGAISEAVNEGNAMAGELAESKAKQVIIQNVVQNLKESK